MEKKQYSVVLVDDDADTRALYADVLREAGFDVREAIDGLEGLEKINQMVPDVVATGIIMPRMDGFMLAEALKKNVGTIDLPVMFLSHLGREEDEARAKAIGVKDFFVTTMTPPHEIIGRIKGLLTSSDYLIIPNPYELDAQRLAQDFGLNRDFLCSDGGEKLAIKLRLKDTRNKRFDAEIVCI
jgi:two-component system chemotaxis response regulator CheY